MATFRVGFDGHWQETFDDFKDAAKWARQVAETGRPTVVAERRGLIHHFRAGFPEEREAELKKRFRKTRGRGYGYHLG